MVLMVLMVPFQVRLVVTDKPVGTEAMVEPPALVDSVVAIARLTAPMGLKATVAEAAMVAEAATVQMARTPARLSMAKTGEMVVPVVWLASEGLVRSRERMALTAMEGMVAAVATRFLWRTAFLAAP